MDNSKVVIVTGGGKGIGAEIVQNLLRDDYRVIISEIDNSLKKHFFYDTSRLLFIKTDVKSETSVKKMINQTYKHFGRIDALINNAGLLPKLQTPFEKISLKTWNEFISTNLTGAFLCTKYAIKHLKKTRGCVINMASTRAYQSEGNDEPYSASKGGLVSLTHSLAVSLGPDIRVNCICPGWINSENEILSKKAHQQHPVGRVGQPEDVAHLVNYLISEEASFITGQCFIIDGGMTVKMIYEN